MKQKLCTLLLAIVVSVEFIYAERIGNLYYILDATNHTATVTKSNNSYMGITEVDIPATVEYGGLTYRVISIGNRAFWYCYQITSISIPSTVTSIESYAFEGCAGLLSIDVPNSVTEIGTGAFSKCTGLTSFTLPDSLYSISGYTFADCTNLSSIDIPNSITNIENYAFNGCTSLTSVTIPKSMEYFAITAFYGCTALSSITWNAQNYPDCTIYQTPFYDSSLTFDLSSQITSFIFGNDVERIPAYICYGMTNLTSVSVGESVTQIGNNAFMNCSNLVSISIPNNVENIEPWAFSNCTRLVSVSLPNTITTIASRLFWECTSLTDITIPSSVTVIEDGAFYDCLSLTNVSIPNTVKKIEDLAFYKCSGLPIIDNLRYADTYLVEAVDKNLSSYIIKEGTKWIGTGAFENCSQLSEIDIPKSVIQIHRQAFKGCSSLTTVNWNAMNCADFDSSNTPFLFSWEHSTQEDFNITSQIIAINFGEEVERIPAYLCYFLGFIESIKIPNSVASIGDYAFSWCQGLSSVEIGENMEELGYECFNLCRALSSIYCHAQNPPICISDDEYSTSYAVFSEVNKSICKLYVPSASIPLYREASEWRSFTYILPLTNNEDIQNNKIDKDSNSKIFRNGQIFILRGDKIYTITGAEVK